MSPLLTFHDGRSMPQFGFGLWQLPPQDTGPLVKAAFDAGYRMIDGAVLYDNETGIGEGLRASGLAREEVFLTSKLRNTDQGHDSTLRSVECSLRRIGTSYLDLYLIHWPVPHRDLYVESWKALIRLRDEGVVRSIGVSNFYAAHIDRLVAETGVLPVLNQVELNPRLQQPELRAYHARQGIVTQGWTPLGQSRSFDAPEIRAISQRLGRSPAQVILRWHVQIGASVIPRSSNPARIRDNAALWDFALSAEDMAAIAAMDCGERTGPDPMVFE